MKACSVFAVLAAYFVSRRALLFFAVILVLWMGAEGSADHTSTDHTWRSFFGVLRQGETQVPALGGPTRMLSHGTTLHGAEALTPRWRCNPLVYYANSAPIGQVFLTERQIKPNLRIGAVGLGTGSVAAYVRASDRLTFFEIDPLVIKISSDPKHFAYTTLCARGPVDYVLGDARLTLARQPTGVFDILLIDAFSSDAVPAHLLTVEAVQGYLTHLKPDGVLILHLSNRNLDLNGPAQAVAKAAGGVALIQHYRPGPDTDRGGWPSPEDAVIIAKSRAALAFVQDPRWKLYRRPRGEAVDRRLHQSVRGALAALPAETGPQQRRLNRGFHADHGLGQQAFLAAGEAHALGGGRLDADAADRQAQQLGDAGAYGVAVRPDLRALADQGQVGACIT